MTGDKITVLELIDKSIDIPDFEPFQVIPDGHRAQIRDMALSVLEDRQPIVADKEGKFALEIILGTYESSKYQKKILLS